MDFGVVLQTNPPAWRTVALAKQAEEHGFDYVWTFDSHLLWQEPYVIYSQILAATRQVTVGPMVTNPATRDWTVTASLFATLNEMIGRLLTIAKLDVSARDIPMVEVDLAELVTQIVRNANFESHPDEDRVKLVAESSVTVHGNPELLHSAIENIVRNAIHYTDSGTQVEVLLERDPAQSLARIAVRDHGPGIPDSELTNIFRPFYRVAAARDRQSGGAGLGLAIADRVIRTHGGSIRAQNASPKGLLIEILLPEQNSGTPQ